MSVVSKASELTLHQALSSPLWDAPFWEALTDGEEVAKRSLAALWDEAFEGETCSCETCIVRTVLEAIWPTLTQQVSRIVALGESGEPQPCDPSPVEGSGCRGSCRCRKE